VDVYAANKTLLQAKDGTEIRLDRLISVDGKPTFWFGLWKFLLSTNHKVLKPATVAGMVKASLAAMVA